MKRASYLALFLALLVGGVAHADNTNPVGYHFPKNSSYRGTDGLFHTLTNTLREDEIGSRIPGLDANGNISGTMVGNIANGVVSGTNTALDMWNKLQTISTASSDATTQVTAMQSQLKALQTSLTYEVSRAQTSEQTIQDSVNKETTRAEKAEQLLMPIAGGVFTGSVGGTTFTASGGYTATGGSIATSGGAVFDLSGTAGTLRNFYLSSGTSHRFTFGLSSTAESGSNNGSDFFLNTFADDGTTQGAVLGVNRATRIVNFALTPTAPTAATADSSNALATTQFVKQVAAGYVPMGGTTGAVNFSGSLTASGPVIAKQGIRGQGTGPINDGLYSQGWSIGWNQETGALGETDYVNMPGTYPGGFAWYNATPDVWANTTTHPNPIMSLTTDGALSTSSVTAGSYTFSESSAGSITSSSTGTLNLSSGAATLQVGSGVVSSANMSVRTTNYPTFVANNYGDPTATSGVGAQTAYAFADKVAWAQGADGSHDANTANSGLDYFITRFNDAGNALDRPVTITRATGEVGINAWDFLGNQVSSSNSEMSFKYGPTNASVVTLGTDGSFSVSPGSSPAMVVSSANISAKVPLSAGEIDSSGPIKVASGNLISNAGVQGGIKFEGQHISYWNTDGTLSGYWAFGDTTPSFNVSIPVNFTSSLNLTGVETGNIRSFVNGGGVSQIYTDAATSTNTANDLVFKVSPNNGKDVFYDTIAGDGSFTASNFFSPGSVTATRFVAAAGVPTASAGYSFSGEAQTGLFSSSASTLYAYVNGTKLIDMQLGAVHFNTGEIEQTGGAYTQIDINSVSSDQSVSGTTSTLQFLKNGLARWGLSANAALETGADNGSNFVLNSVHDDGTWFDNPMTIVRATSLVTFSKNVQIGAGVTTGWGTGAGAGYGFTADSGHNTGMYSTSSGQLSLYAGGLDVLDINSGGATFNQTLTLNKAVTFSGAVSRAADPAFGDDTNAIPTTRWVNSEIRTLSTANTYGIADTCSTQGCLYVTTQFNVITSSSSDGSGAITLPAGSSATNGANYIVANRSASNVCVYGPTTSDQIESLGAGVCLTLAPAQTMHFISAGDSVHWTAF